MATLVKVKQVEYPAADAVTLRFEKMTELESYLPGQHLSVTAVLAGEKVTRTYSLSSSPVADQDLAITIRNVLDGKLSGHLVDFADAGMTLELEGPLGQFTVRPDKNTSRHFVMFAGGSGITPIMSMLRTVLAVERESQVSLIYANHSYERIIFLEELQSLEQEYSNRFRVFHALSDPATAPVGKPLFYKGKLGRLIVRKLVKQLQAEILLPAAYYLCGPFGFMQMVEEALSSLGVTSNNINKEHFFIPKTTAEESFDEAALPPQRVGVHWQGQCRNVEVAPGNSLLEAALLAGLTLPYSCREGQCGTCRATVLNGEVKMKRNHILSPAEISQKQVLLCQGYPASEGVAIAPINR